MLVRHESSTRFALCADDHIRRKESPPLACIFGMSRLYCTYIPPVSYRILGIPCIPVSILYLSVLQKIHCIQRYPTVSSCIRTYLAVSRSISPYLTVSHRLENGISPKIHARGGLMKRVGVVYCNRATLI